MSPFGADITFDRSALARGSRHPRDITSDQKVISRITAAASPGKTDERPAALTLLLMNPLREALNVAMSLPDLFWFDPNHVANKRPRHCVLT